MPCISRKMILLLAVLSCLDGRGFAATTIGSITITGTEQSSGGVWDAGTVTATINGVSVSLAYGQFSTPSAIASTLGALISQNCNMPVYAHASGTMLNFYVKGSNVINSVNITSVSNNPGLFSTDSFLVNGGETLSISIPQIASLSLSEGPPGMGFVITGTGFSSNAQVTIGGFPATIIGTPTGTQIIVQVPSSLSPPAIGGVVVNVNGWLSQSFPFDVVVPFGCN